MANFSGKYMKVWKKDGNKVDLGDSSKNQDGSYTNWSWFGCLLCGKAKDVEINEGDTVEVKSGQVSQNKYNDKWYTNVKVFDIEVMSKGKAPKVEEEMVAIDDLDSMGGLPF